MGLRGKVTQYDIAKACKLDQGSISRILNKDYRDLFSKQTVQKVFNVARQMGYLHPALVTAERRASQRKRLGIIAQTSFIVDGSVWDSGTAEVDLISMSGLLLKNFQMKKNQLPLKHVRIDIELDTPKLREFKCRGHIARFADQHSEFALAIKYDGLDQDARAKLESFLTKR
jgi:hypothetical protein